MKLLIKTVISLFIAVNLLAPPVYASDYTEGFLRYKITDNSVAITGYFGKDPDVTVPNRIGDYPVSIICKGAFVGTKAKVVHLPDTIMKIEEGAFASDVKVNRPGSKEEPEREPERDQSTEESTSAPANESTGAAAESAAKPESTETKKAQTGSGSSTNGKAHDGTPKEDTTEKEGLIIEEDPEDGAGLEEVEVVLEEEDFEEFTSSAEEESETEESKGTPESEETKKSEEGQATGNPTAVLLLALCAIGAVIFWQRNKND